MQSSKVVGKVAQNILPTTWFGFKEKLAIKCNKNDDFDDDIGKKIGEYNKDIDGICTTSTNKRAGNKIQQQQQQPP